MESNAENKAKTRLDLHGITCPMNFVEAKLALEELEPGDLLELILDEGDPLLNVSRSLKEQGHRIIKVEPQGETFLVLVERGKE